MCINFVCSIFALFNKPCLRVTCCYRSITFIFLVVCVCLCVSIVVNLVFFLLRPFQLYFFFSLHTWFKLLPSIKRTGQSLSYKKNMRFDHSFFFWYFKINIFFIVILFLCFFVVAAENKFIWSVAFFPINQWLKQ